MMNKFGTKLDEFLKFNNISVKEFAERIGTSPKNLNDILKGNVELSQNMIYNISFITEIPVSYIENVESNYKLDKTIDEYLKNNNITISQYINKFNYKEFSKKYDYKFSDERNPYSVAKGLLRYLRITNPEILYKSDNTIFYKSSNDKPELLALWLEHCYKVVIEQKVSEYNKNNISNLVNYIREEAKKNIFDKKAIIKEFNKNGIYLAVEEDLSGSKIRGAFKVLNNKPAIYITGKHKRFADAYFALLHELAHCKSDFNRAKNGGIVSSVDDVSTEEYELKADATAFNWMVEDSYYNSIKDNPDSVNSFDVIKSFYVYRLAHDGKINYSSKLYQDNNKLIGDF